jgi:predicted MFS family arabinose efflux permease
MVSTGRAQHQERRLLWLLAALQFTHLFDLMMISPLGPQFMRLWQLSAGEFGVLVAVYAVAAALAGIAASFVIDRFDRRSVLLVAYAGFTLSTLACALAPGYASFLVARGLAGVFGGVIGSIVMALVGDLIPVERRGRAMGLVMSAFPLVAVAGIPFGLWLGTLWGWQMPFFCACRHGGGFVVRNPCDRATRDGTCRGEGGNRRRCRWHAPVARLCRAVSAQGAPPGLAGDVHFHHVRLLGVSLHQRL